ncbi:MAG TPA: hypothetical protein VD969_06275 [Symbiobacteriaceae bacterium]|nr:hypothetical protein [Symbiobacteriaceae bacterium]
MAVSLGPQDATHLELIRLRLGDRMLVVPTTRPDRAAPARAPTAPVRSALEIAPPPAQPLILEAPQTEAPIAPRLRYKPVIAVVDAAPCGVERLLADLVAEVEGAGGRCGIVSLDRQNRLALRFDCSELSPHWCWNSCAPELFIRQNSRVVVTAPDSEAGLQPEAIQRTIRSVIESTDAVVIDLGCRWEPRVFRPALTLATSIWMVTRAGQWTAMEMRLEQAEFSGWTDISRVRLVALGDADLPPVGLPSVVTLPPAGGWVLQEFLARELRGGR